MSAAAVLAFAGALFGGVFALIAGLRARRSAAHWPFAVGMAILAVEEVCNGLAAVESTASKLIAIQQWRLFAISMLPGIWLIFSQTYARGNARDFLAKRRLKLAAGLSLPTVLTVIFRDHLIDDAMWNSAKSHWVLRLGWTGIALYAALLIGSVLVLMNLERTYRAAVGTMRWRIKFMLLGVGALFVVRIYTSSQALMFRGLDPSVESLNSGAMAAAALLLARSFFRAGHFDVDVYPSQSVLQGSITVLIAGIYLMVVGLLAKVATYLGGDNAFALKSFLTLILLVALAVILQSDRARLHLNRFVSRNFQRPQHDYRTVWIRFTEATASCVEQTELCRALVKLTEEMFQTLSVAIWLLDDKREGLSLAASTFLSGTGNGTHAFTRSDTDRVVRQLIDHPEPTDIESSEQGWASAVRSMHPSEFPNGGHRVMVPLLSRGEVIGVLTLGDRVAGSVFTVQDFDVLKCIGDHAGASLRNVQLSHKLLEAKELQAFQTMAAFFVHDLKNAASTLSLMLQNLPNHFDDPAFRDDSLRGISKTVGHIDGLIGRLSLLRHETGSKPVESDLNEIVSKAVADLEGSFGSILSKDLLPVPGVRLDREQMAKVVTNLVLNATEAVPPDGRVRIETKVEGDWVMLVVGDNGCGMSREFLSRGLFRPFQTTKKNGLGIGMFQSKLIVEAHGGRIEVTSELRKGTTFRVLLPVAKQPA